ncbi:seryl-tRNA synthetase [Heterostelium album PN500]|uniref:serine--tRNA ligase n=1 Tax=Heterostelium pallidum (strain ATCC 26659 / Pp 5 / PN500) TaxID=670386 RepID=D3BEX2_HETP5|nr:seryl-tRNA synthetase [Heterostelium album PN500]EFA80453.1 seryl-tRNA synthetase [Heterostelium album PN500]|eukprot:XP_020432573.1 seryl-tRNA synthetase [Heterostelium album PN500]
MDHLWYKMGLDIVMFRAPDKGGNPDLIRLSQERRFKPVETVQTVIDLDMKLRDAKYRLDQTNAEYTKVNKELAIKKKAGESGEEVDKLVARAAEIDKNIVAYKLECAQAEDELKKAIKPIGNIVHESVPVSNNEDNNQVVRTWGEPKTQKDLLHHHELLEMIDGYDLVRGTNVSGHRCYFLKGVGVELNLAIINYGLAFLKKRSYTHLQTPFFMRKEIMAETAQLEQFDEELYKIVGGAQGEENEKYLIATSEQPISSYHRGEWIEEKDLPKMYSGYSTCFRKEAGAHGRDVWGIFRVHQFEKIEQFVITKPEDSWAMHEQMIATAEAFYQELGLPYQVISIVSGALNNAAAKKYDLEGWFPGYNQYRELVSCSNCTDYQSRDLEIRCGMKKQGQQQKKYVHMLNSTLAATTRVICCILENYQTEGGINVPKVLQPYMGGVEFIPFVKPKPKQK